MIVILRQCHQGHPAPLDEGADAARQGRAQAHLQQWRPPDDRAHAARSVGARLGPEQGASGGYADRFRGHLTFPKPMVRSVTGWYCNISGCIAMRSPRATYGTVRLYFIG